MKKIKVTRKEIKEGWRNIICVGYCDLQWLLYYKNADFYSTRVEGWACDYYVINSNTIISTGYAPIGNIRNYEINRAYDNKAREIVCSNEDYEKKVEKLDDLLEKYVAEMLEDSEK